MSQPAMCECPGYKWPHSVRDPACHGHSDHWMQWEHSDGPGADECDCACAHCVETARQVAMDARADAEYDAWLDGLAWAEDGSDPEREFFEREQAPLGDR